MLFVIIKATVLLHASVVENDHSEGRPLPLLGETPRKGMWAAEAMVM